MALAGPLHDIVRTVQIWWLVGALCFVGGLVVWGIIKNKKSNWKYMFVWHVAGFCKTHEGGENTLQLISLLLVTAEERYTS